MDPLDDDELQKSLIAAPTPWQQPRDLPPVMLDAKGSQEKPSAPMQSSLQIATPSQNNATPVDPNIQAHKDERNRIISSGSGISQISNKIQGTQFGQNHPILSKVLGGAAQGIATLGDVGLSAVAPSLAINLPGTAYHHQLALNQANKVEAQDTAEAQRNAETQKQLTDAALDQAKTAQTNEETGAAPGEQAEKQKLTDAQIGKLQEDKLPTLQQLHAKAVKDAVDANRDPSTDPLVQNYADAITSIQKQPTAKAGTKTVQLEVGGKPHQVLIDEATGKTVQDLGESGEKPPTINVNAGTAALDRETKQFGGSHQKALDASQAQLEKIDDARAMINGNAESQALGIPKVLTALVSGQGSGVRITQPELNAIGKARGLSGDIEGTLNSWAGKGKLTPEQQRQLSGILDDVKARVSQKAAIHGAALDAINGAGTRQDIIKADADARKKVSDLESSGGGGQIMVKAPNGKEYPFKDQAAADAFKKEAGIK